jgi:hypothetical protein
VTGSAAGAVPANKRGSDNSTDRLRGRLRAASFSAVGSCDQIERAIKDGLTTPFAGKGGQSVQMTRREMPGSTASVLMGNSCLG